MRNAMTAVPPYAGRETPSARDPRFLPTDAGVTPDRRLIRLRIPSRKELNRLFKDCQRLGDEALPCAVLLALECDLQAGTIATLRWADVDFVNHEVVVRPLDGQAARVVPMPSRLCEALQRYGRQEHRDPMFFPSDSRETAVARIKDTFHRTAHRLGLALDFDSLWQKFAGADGVKGYR
jgi:integrase